MLISTSYSAGTSRARGTALPVPGGSGSIRGARRGDRRVLPCPGTSLSPGAAAVAFSAGVWHVAMATPQSAPSHHQHRSVSAVRPSVTGRRAEPSLQSALQTELLGFPSGSPRCPPARLPLAGSPERSARRQRPGGLEGMAVTPLRRWVPAKGPRCRAVPRCWATARAELSRGILGPGGQSGTGHGQGSARDSQQPLLCSQVCVPSLLFIKLRCKMEKK